MKKAFSRMQIIFGKLLRKIDETGSPSHTVIIIGIILSLSIGLLDQMIGMLHAEGAYSLRELLLPLATTTGVLFFIFIFSWFFVAIYLARLLKLDHIPLALSAAIFLGIACTLGLLNGFITISLFTGNLIKVGIIVVISFTVSLWAYFANGALISKSKSGTIAAVGSFIFIFLLIESTLFIWIQKQFVESSHSLSSLILILAFILLAISTVCVFSIIGTKIGLTSFLTIIIILVFLSPLVNEFINLAIQKNTKVFAEGYKSKHHKIRHVILITIDTLRPDFLSCYNQQGVNTPNIDSFANDGILFTNVISSSPWTLPSVAAIMTGLPPSVHMTTKAKASLPSSFVTLAEYMLSAGYLTGAIGLNIFLTEKYNISQGFIHYDFYPKDFGPSNSFGGKIIRKLRKLHYPSTDYLTDLACNWFEENYQKDFFFWIHYLDPHVPYSPPVRFIPKKEPPPRIGTKFFAQNSVRGGILAPSQEEREWIRTLYGCEVQYVDENIGRLMDRLKKLNLYNESLIILTSDHGEEFWEHGGYEHGHSLYNEVLRVPLMIKLPLSASNSNRVLNELVTTVSIMPTILDLCEIPYGSDNYLYGTLSPLWGTNPDTFKRGPVIGTAVLYYENKESVIFHDLKYIRALVTNREELYDLTADPGEQTSISSVSRDKTQLAKNVLIQYSKTAKTLRERYGASDQEQIQLDSETLERLRSLGYVQ